MSPLGVPRFTLPRIHLTQPSLYPFPHSANLNGSIVRVALSDSSDFSYVSMIVKSNHMTSSHNPKRQRGENMFTAGQSNGCYSARFGRQSCGNRPTFTRIPCRLTCSNISPYLYLLFIFTACLKIG